MTTATSQKGPKTLVNSQASLGSAAAATPTPDGLGFWIAWSGGKVTTEGDAHWFGDMSQVALARPIVGIEATPTGHGYWLLGADGGVFSFGDASFHGSTGGMRLVAAALQMATTPNGAGYDFVAGDGGIFSFGNAAFHGSTGNLRLARPVVGMAMTPTGAGYWLVASDGGIFAFGNAAFHGSTGNIRLAKPVVGMARTANGGGYWMVASDGGVFAFGNARFHGSAAGRTGGSPAVGMVATRTGAGYWIVLASGRVLSFGDAAPVSGTAVAPAAPPAPPGSYAFEVLNSAGAPARWNPCESIRYAVVYPGAPAGWQNDVSNVLSQVTGATGIHFVNAGTYSSASQVPSSAALKIEWSSTLTNGSEVGLSTYWYYNTPGYRPQMVQSTVQLLAGLSGGGGANGEQPVLLHELGHTMGLAHTNSAEVMNPVDQGYTSYQSGDRAGLFRLGASQGCGNFYQ